MKLHLVIFNTFSNFGKDNYYDDSIVKLKESFLANGGDEVHHYTEDTLPISKEYREYCEKYRNRSFGFYGFKPVIILDVFEKISSGDIVLYHDAGRPEYNYQFNKDLKAFATNIKDKYQGLGLSHGFWKHNELTRDYCFKEMGCDTPFVRSKFQLAANWGFYEKNLKVINFVKEWKEWCQKHEVIRTEEESEKNHTEFKTHRWDQSILTNLLYLYSFKTLPNLEEWEKNINNFIQNYYKIENCLTFNEIDGNTLVVDLFYENGKLVVITPANVEGILLFNSIKPDYFRKNTYTNKFSFKIPYYPFITLTAIKNQTSIVSKYLQFNVKYQVPKTQNNNIIFSTFNNNIDKLEDVAKFIDTYINTGVDKVILYEYSGDNYKNMLSKLNTYLQSEKVIIYCSKGIKVEGNMTDILIEAAKERFEEVNSFIPIKI